MIEKRIEDFLDIYRRPKDVITIKRHKLTSIIIIIM